MGVRVVLLGGPGAGKGTQGRRLSDAYDVPHVATGDIFRDLVKKDSPVAREVRQCLANGTLVSDDLAVRVTKDELRKSAYADGFVLDGFPRSTPQAEAFNEWNTRRGQPLDAALSFDVSDEEIVSRVLNRRQCPQCGAIYNLKSKPPRTPGRCDKNSCRGFGLVQRADDNEETIRARLRVYHETTEPILAYYEERGLLRRIPGDGFSPDEVFEKVEEVVSALGVA